MFHYFRRTSLLAMLLVFLAGFVLAVPVFAKNETDLQLMDHILSHVATGQADVHMGDMVFKTAKLQAYRSYLAARESGVGPRSAFEPMVTTWPGGVVPVAFDPAVTSAHRTAFAQAFNKWASAANIKMSSDTSGNYIYVRNTTDAETQNEDGHSYIGDLQQGAQELALAPNGWSNVYEICHEIGHALGLMHEHQRSDRDSYVTIHEENFDTSQYSIDYFSPNFDKVPGSINKGAYDIDSIMHYSLDAFAKPGTYTIVPKFAYSGTPGQDDHLSPGDLNGMALMYGKATSSGPGNDNFVSATTLSGSSGKVSGSNVGATKETGEPNHAGNAGGASVWFKWTAPAAGAATFNTVGSAFDTVLAVYTGSKVSALTLVANGSNDDLSSSDQTSQVTISVAAGVTYYIAVDGYDGATGKIVLSYSGPVASTQTWTCIDVATAFDNTSRLLWTTPGGLLSIWRLDAANNQLNAGPAYGPYSGWKPIAIGAANDGTSRVLWVDGSGDMSMWKLDSAGNFVSVGSSYGPYSGWTPVDMATAPDGTSRVLWRSTSGQLSIWRVDAAGNQLGISPTYGPYSGWTPRRISAAKDGGSRVLWTNTNGQTSLWRLDAAGNQQNISPTYGPNSGWTAVDVATAGDGTSRILWRSSGGQAAVWKVDANGASPLSSPAYGPYSGWTPLAIGAGNDGKTRLLWVNGGQASLWLLDAAGNQLSVSPTYGPFAASSAAPSSSPRAASAVQFSTATAHLDGTVQLTFTGALNSSTTADATHFSVQVNGVDEGVQSAAPGADSQSVTLTLPAALHNGDQVSIAWHDLSDAQGKTLAGQAGPVTAR